VDSRGFLATARLSCCCCRRCGVSLHRENFTAADKITVTYETECNKVYFVVVVIIVIIFIIIKFYECLSFIHCKSKSILPFIVSSSNTGFLKRSLAHSSGNLQYLKCVTIHYRVNVRKLVCVSCALWHFPNSPE